MDNYFIFNGVTYVIIYDDKKIKILKKVDNKLVELDKSEKKKIESFFSREQSHKYSSLYLTECLNDNNVLEKKDYILPFLEWLEKLIPKDSRDNFYRNIRTLSIDYNFECLDRKKSNNVDTNIEGAGYNCTRNHITINKEYLEYLSSISNDENFIYNNYAGSIMHELAHMASANYDRQTNISKCGFNTYPFSDENDNNRGLTEGMTELISFTAIPFVSLYTSGYFMEMKITKQLEMIVGTNVLLESYFSNKGLEEIKNNLLKYINDENKVFSLFRNIEFNYLIRDLTDKQSILGNIQSSLLDFLEAKCKKELENPYLDKEMLINMLDSYEKNLIDESDINSIRKNPDNYVGINKNKEQFLNIKDKYLSAINDIDKYQEYREKTKKLYQEKNDKESLLITFDIKDDNKKCRYKLELLDDDKNKRIVSNDEFDFNFSFVKNMLEPTISYYANSNSISEATNFDDMLYFIANNKNAIVIKGIDSTYANKLLSDIDTKKESKLKEKEFIKNISGFSTTTILLTYLVGTTIICLAFLIIYIL